MNQEQNLVRLFHLGTDLLVEDRPCFPESKTVNLRKTLILEEANELVDALQNGSLDHIAKEMADVMYVVYGAAVSYGIDLEPVFKEVHRSNMSKIGGRKRDDGKVEKPLTYSPADIASIIQGQRDT